MKLAMITLAAGAAVASTLALGTAALAAKESPLATAAPARGTGLATGQCFRTHDIRNHTLADRSTLLLNVNGKDTYRVTVDGGCLAGAISSDPIVTRSPPGSSIVCKPIDLDLGVAKSGGFENRCIIQSIVKMTPAEVAALPKKLKP